jgi:HK97 family phage prohead protease
MRVKTASISHFKTLDEDGEPEGTFEAIVSVFGNVDYAGDRVVKGAFAKSLANWASSGDPIPVIWSHQWQDPEMHIGGVLETEERDEGLWVKAQLDVADDPVAAKVWRLLSTRRVREFSFAYDVYDEKQQNGANELLEIDVIEVGPTLKGMNPDTLLLEAKARRDARAAKAAAAETGEDTAPEPVENGSVPAPTALPGATVDTEIGEAGEDTDAADDDDTAEDDDGEKAAGAARTGRKAQVTLEGSYEHLQEQLRGAVTDWAAAAFPGVDLYVAGLEATYHDHVIVYVETWSQPWGGGDYHQAGYEIESDGTVVLGDPTPVELTGVAVPKCLPAISAAKKDAADAARPPAEAPPAPAGLSAVQILASV